ncbi:MAG: hypothetical protein IPP83_19340 [Flavobacteriales bacterium]|nr:hypothetical protein [Flavobacteriales bacterium]
MRPTALPVDWAYSPALDLELKQYTLLAYLQRVKRRFDERKLYPHLQELQWHIDELIALRDRMRKLEGGFPGELIGFDLRTGGVMNEALPKDPFLGVVDELIELALPNLRDVLADGQVLSAEIADHIHFSPVGVLPLHAREGWLLLHTRTGIRVYNYEVALVRSREPASGLEDVRTRFVTTYSTGLLKSYEWVKADLVAAHRMLPNPAVFAFHTDLALPHVETFIPLAKQLVYEVVGKSAQ